MSVKCLAYKLYKEHNEVPWPSLEPGPFDLESSALTTSIFIFIVSLEYNLIRKDSSLCFSEIILAR